MSELKSGEWICPVCETINAGNTCFICGTAKPQEDTVQTLKAEIQDNTIIDDKISAAKFTEAEDQKAVDDSRAENKDTKNSNMLLIFGVIIFIIVMCALFFKIFEYDAYLYEENCSFDTNNSIISLSSISDERSLTIIF